MSSLSTGFDSAAVVLRHQELAELNRSEHYYSSFFTGSAKDFERAESYCILFLNFEEIQLELCANVLRNMQLNCASTVMSRNIGPNPLQSWLLISDSSLFTNFLIWVQLSL